MGSMNAIPQTFEFWQDRRMPYVETRRSCFGRTCYKSHSHPTFSIGAIDEGIVFFKVLWHCTKDHGGYISYCARTC